MSGKTLAVKLNDADYAHYQQLAQEAGLTLADWTRRKLAEPSRPAPVVVDEAFRRLDVSDHMRELSGKPPPPPSAPVPLPVVELGKPAPGVTHSCIHHTAVTARGAGVRTVCGSTHQRGRPCYWPSAGAKDCMYFTPRQS